MYRPFATILIFLAVAASRAEAPCPTRLYPSQAEFLSQNNVIRFCFSGEKTTCYEYNINQDRYNEVAVVPHHIYPGDIIEQRRKRDLTDTGYVFHQDGQKVSACKRGSCVEVQLRDLKMSKNPFSVNQDGSLLLVNYQKTTVYDLFDLTTGRRIQTLQITDLENILGPRKRLARWALTNDDSHTAQATLLGSSVYIQLTPCVRSCDSGLVVDARSNKLIALLTNQKDAMDFFADDTHPVRWKGDVWAFNESTGQRVLLLNVKTGKEEASISLDSIVPREMSYDYSDANPWPQNVHNFGFVKGDAYYLLFVHERLPGVVLKIDLPSGKIVRTSRLNKCPVSP